MYHLLWVTTKFKIKYFSHVYSQIIAILFLCYRYQKYGNTYLWYNKSICSNTFTQLSVVHSGTTSGSSNLVYHKNAIYMLHTLLLHSDTMDGKITHCFNTLIVLDYTTHIISTLNDQLSIIPVFIAKL